MADFLPKDAPSLVIWLGNYQAKLTTYGATLGLTLAEVTALSTACTDLSTLINKVKQKRQR